MTTKYSDIKDGFGSGGANLVPNQGIPSLRDVLRDLLARTGAPVANVAALTATLAADRVDGMQVVKLDDYTSWTWQAASTATADARHIAPTDVGVGAGRWVREDAIAGGVLETATYQATAIAASLTATAMLGGFPVAAGGTLKSLFVVLGQTLFAAGESAVVNIKKDGTTILTGTITLDSTILASGVIDFSSRIVAATAVAPGDQLTIEFVYTAGGGPAHPSFQTVLQWG